MELKISKILFFIILTTGLFAISKEDRIIRASLYPYVVKGITYYPHKVSVGEYKEVKTSWYGEYFHGRKTANGEIYDMHGYTAAHKTYPLGTVLMVRNPKNSKSLKVRVNDRGPFWNDRELDLSMGAAEFLGTKRAGVAMVTIEVISVPSIAQSFTPVKGKKPKEVSYNVGHTAMSYSIISDNSKNSLFEIGVFQEKKQANTYLKKLKKHFPKAYVSNEDHSYKVKFLLSSNETMAIKKLKNLKKIRLITGYALCWSYE